MKYFIDGISREKWHQNMQLYWENFNRIKNRLSTQMIEIFLSDYLHDSEITSINFLKVTNKKRNVYNLTLYLKNEEFEGGIVHYDVIKYTNSFSNSLDFGYPCEYLYGEVLYEDELWSHNIRYTENNELSIHCKSIDWIANS